MGKILDAAEPLVRVLWRGETEGKDFSTPERRAGLERALAEIVSLIADGKIADYYRREFDSKVFETFKRRAAAGTGTSGELARSEGRRDRFGRRHPRNGFAGGEEQPAGPHRAERGAEGQGDRDCRAAAGRPRKSPSRMAKSLRRCLFPIPCLTGCATNS